MNRAMMATKTNALNIIVLLFFRLQTSLAKLEESKAELQRVKESQLQNLQVSSIAGYRNCCCMLSILCSG